MKEMCIRDRENSAAPQKEQRRNTWTNADGSIRPISKWSGVNSVSYTHLPFLRVLRTDEGFFTD